MATPSIVSYFLNTANNLTGSLILVGFVIVAFFLISFMMGGVDFKWSLMLCIPLIMGLSGYLLPVWVAGIIWLLVIGVGGYVAINYLSERV